VLYWSDLCVQIADLSVTRSVLSTVSDFGVRTEKKKQFFDTSRNDLPIFLQIHTLPVLILLSTYIMQP